MKQTKTTLTDEAELLLRRVIGYISDDKNGTSLAHTPAKLKVFKRRVNKVFGTHF